jgi:hypothetical protein
MANISDAFSLDATGPTSNSNYAGANISEGCQPSNLNNALRQLGSFLAQATSYQSPSISASVSTNVAGSVSGYYQSIVGVGPINSFGTVPGQQPSASPFRILHFATSTSVSSGGSITLVGNASRKTTPGEVAAFIHEGSSDSWREIFNTAGAQLNVSNTFTAAQGITSTGAGTLLTLTSMDAGAGTGPDIDLFRDSASPAVADFVASLLFNGRDSGGNKTPYGSITNLIGSPTNGSEFGRLRFSTIQNGSFGLRFNLDAGFYSNGLTDKGDGTLNAAGVYVGGHGTVAQEIVLTSAATDSTATAIPNDTSKPQIGEGKQVFSQAITPLNANSIITVEAVLQLSHASTGTDLAAVIFDSAVSATDSVAVGPVAAAGTHMTPAVAFYSVTAGSTSSRTISVRYGGNTGTTFLNQGSSTAYYGGTIVSKVTIRETLPQ